jgi:ferredoxin-NADP reductase
MSEALRDPMLPAPYRVLRVQHEIPDTFTLELEPCDGGAVLPFACGQFNML